MFALVFVSPPQAGQCSQGGLVCPSWFASCLGEGGGGGREGQGLTIVFTILLGGERRGGWQFFSSIYKCGSRCRVSPSGAAMVAAACVAPHLLRIILFAFIKLFLSFLLFLFFVFSWRVGVACFLPRNGAVVP